MLPDGAGNPEKHSSPYKMKGDPIQDLVEPGAADKLRAMRTRHFPVRIGLCVLLCGLSSEFACAGNDRDLGVDPPVGPASSSSGAGGAGGSGAGGDIGGGANNSIPEPDGPPALTIVNGINDYDAIQLCFIPYPGGDASKVFPWPSEISGLPFAKSRVVSPISSVIPSNTDVHVYAIGGDLELGAGKNCADIIALADTFSEMGGGGGAGGAGGAGGSGGSGGAAPIGPFLVARSLAALPGSAFTALRSLLLVPAGCMGGPGHTDPVETIACGKKYSPSNPTSTLIALAMSRITNSDRINLQAVHAAIAMDEVDIRIKPSGQEDWPIASEISMGAVAPKPPFDSLSAEALGPAQNAQILTYYPASLNPTSSTLLGDSFALNPNIQPSDFKNGSSFVLVAVGSAPSLPDGAFWHRLRYSLVRANP